MLKEFAFEAKVGSLSDPDEGRKIPERLKQALFDFLENGLEENLLCPEQLTLLFKEFESLDELMNRLLFLEEGVANVSFSEICAKCKAALHSISRGVPENASFSGSCIAALHLWPGLETEKLLEDFRALAKNYKAEVKGNFEAQVMALAEGNVRPLLKERGSVFDFLDPSNRKVRRAEPPFLHYPGFFDWGRNHLAPLLKQKVFPMIQAAWKPIAERILKEEDHLDPDEILLKMQRATENGPFAQRIREKYAAAIIDEFQDTDAVQWDIFKRLFIDHPVKALYLVGDPKQSIYRFRKADVYTYIQARDELGEESVYQLDTNYRSSPRLISALNTLFQRDWLHLPKVQRTLPYFPVKAGVKIDSAFNDEKGALHFLLAEGEPGPLFEEVFLPYAIREIEKLQAKCAILVKDRYQSEKAVAALKERGIAAVAKSHVPIGETLAFQAVRELFEAALSPRSQSTAKVVQSGPFASLDVSFVELKVILEEKGLVPFSRLVLKEAVSSDILQIFELFFEWEQREGFSFEGLKRYLKQLAHLKADEGGRRRMEVDEEAVQVMTLHISKGLEFDVVFALGLPSRTPGSEGEVEELEAEKLRQLYVAMTRAKKRLYVPIACGSKEAEKGTHSPMELFCRYWQSPVVDYLKTVSQKESITYEQLVGPIELGAPPERAVKKSFREEIPPPLLYKPSLLSSFTSLAKTEEREVKWSENTPGVFDLQTMPRGSETGILIHQIFEQIFLQKIWRTPVAIEALIDSTLQFTSLASWKEVIQQMALNTLQTPLQAFGEFFSLSELEPDQLQVEMEFLFSTPPHFVKGFIDLVFCHQKRVYFIDWKTNWLESYDQTSLREEMRRHDYSLQASLYAEAIQRHFNMPYGGAFYLFVRGQAQLFIEGGSYGP
jgi:exodeoxyribonuclease V beta subunit